MMLAALAILGHFSAASFAIGPLISEPRISPSGVLGDPTRASADKGRRMWDLMVRNLVDFVEDLKSLSLDEIHQRRY